MGAAQNRASAQERERSLMPLRTDFSTPVLKLSLRILGELSTVFHIVGARPNFDPTQ
jgi:hypothetical protein